MVHVAIDKLVDYAIRTHLIAAEDRTWAINGVLACLHRDEFFETHAEIGNPDLHSILNILVDDAFTRGLLPSNSLEQRDLFDTQLMGCLTPRPSCVAKLFRELYAENPKKATDWFYQFSQDTNYIRRDRIAKDVKWVAPTEYGNLDITINLSKPEKTPLEIANIAQQPSSSYPKCFLCSENEGYAGHLGHPARQHHRVIPVTLMGEPWGFQFSPFVYYPQHAIAFCQQHTPMKIDRDCFAKLLDFVRQFPHYFIGSNADLPIVGGSILAHDHFQCGQYTFAMELAPVEKTIDIPNFSDVEVGIVRWPVSVVRLTCNDPQRLVALADRMLQKWQSHSDPDCSILAHTDGTPHNTITPIARKKGAKFQLDLALRNNMTTPQHPTGLFHPHAYLHHIKRENIGLIEVMGLAVLPARLKEELVAVGKCLVHGGDLYANPSTFLHGKWAEALANSYEITTENIEEIIKKEVGLAFEKSLEHAGVFKRTPQGQIGFLKFLATI